MHCSAIRPRLPLPLVLVALLSLLPACQSMPLAPSEAVTNTAPAPSELRDARVGGVLNGDIVQLRNGVFEGDPFVSGGASRPRLEVLTRLTAGGEVEGRREPVRLAFLAASAGGSGVDIYLAAFARSGDVVVSVASILIGDRVQLRGISVADGRINVDVVEAGPSDAMCCVTQLARKTYRLNQSGFVMVSSEVTGRLSLHTLEGADWTLEELDDTPLAPDLAAPTLRIADGTVSGFGGCNRYRGGIRETSPGSVALAPVLSTRMACDGPRTNVEDPFLRRLQKVTSYRFVEGRLALYHDDENGRPGRLLFHP